MLLTEVDGGLESLKGCFVNPLQPLALIFGNACASHQEPACSELCLSITTVGSKFIPEDAFLQVLLHTIAIPIGGSDIFLTENMPLEGCLAIPEECLVMILLCAVAEIVGIGHIDL